MSIIVCLFMSPIFPKMEFFQFTWDHKLDSQQYYWLTLFLNLVKWSVCWSHIYHPFSSILLLLPAANQLPLRDPQGSKEPDCTPISRGGTCDAS